MPALAIVSSMGSSPRYGHLLAMMVALGACRGRTPPGLALDWKAGKPEAAAVLLLDGAGAIQRLCLPGRAPARSPYPGVVLGRFLDVGWKGGPLVAGWARESGPRAPATTGELVLLVPGASPRRLAKDVRSARFAPDGTALAYEVSPRATADASGAPPTSFVLELATGQLTRLEGFADPLWEGDGRSLRGTRLRSGGPDPTAPWTSLRARWDRQTGLTTIDGRGSAQVPAPVGPAVAWSEAQRGRGAPDYCAVLLNRGGGVSHLIAGAHCAGVVDDLAMGWSPDGRWLAFTHPGPGQGKPGGFFVDVVSPQGGRYPALSALSARVRPAELALRAEDPGSVRYAWAPSGRFLAVQDGAHEVLVYDFVTLGLARLGKGERPGWSPGGGYLMLLASPERKGARGSSPIPEAFVLPGAPPAARLDLGPAREVRFLPAQACDP